MHFFDTFLNYGAINNKNDNIIILRLKSYFPSFIFINISSSEFP